MANATSVANPPVSRGRAKFVPRNAWIIGPREDFVLFLGTPLILIPLFGFAQSFWSIAGLSVFATVLAMGHYLPGLMRAYGDPQLFRRYRLRFILAPLFFLPLSLYMAAHESQAFLLVVVGWGAWHWLMQTYGLVRIYDAKAKHFDGLSARLDYALCISWFGVLYWQTDGAAGVFMRFYRAGGVMPPELVGIFTKLWFAATLAISVVYLWHLGRKLRMGQPPSILKISLLLVSFFFYLYAFGYSSSKLVAFGLFEGYHDIQYLAIVWVFNRGRAAQSDAGGFTRYLFRQRWPLALLYVFLCLGFGSYDFFARSIDDVLLGQLALGLITGFALIHFYFDGFIWRIREPETRKSLGVDSSGNAVRRWQISPSARHGLLWAILLVPVALLFTWERAGGARTDVDACRAVLAARPNSHKAHYLLASVLSDEKKVDEALEHIQTARKLRPGYDLYEMLYGDLLMAKGVVDVDTLDQVIVAYQKALPTRVEVVNLRRNLGIALSMRGYFPDAALHFEKVIELDPNDAATHVELANTYARLQQLDSAADAYQNALTVNPQDVDVLGVLGSVRMAQNRPVEAIDCFRRVVKADPESVRGMVNLAMALASVSDGNLRDPNEARRLAELAAQSAAADDVAIWRDLATTYAALGDKQATEAAIQKVKQQ
ncbi:MAG: tetratricopeptide repeat protein [Planctomycetaceae bacterium]|nr:tetratricopeptide repeat protein [Planctomycetaceae bacterium]